jgi:hypothetical protein
MCRCIWFPILIIDGTKEKTINLFVDNQNLVVTLQIKCQAICLSHAYIRMKC